MEETLSVAIFKRTFCTLTLKLFTGSSKLLVAATESSTEVSVRLLSSLCACDDLEKSVSKKRLLFFLSYVSTPSRIVMRRMLSLKSPLITFNNLYSSRTFSKCAISVPFSSKMRTFFKLTFAKSEGESCSYRISSPIAVCTLSKSRLLSLETKS